MSKIKKVERYDLFATGDAIEFSMAGEPKYMYADLTPSKHYAGVITNVDTMRNEFTISIVNDLGRQVTLTHFADPVRQPVAMPLYFHMVALLDRDTYNARLYSRYKKDLKYAERRYKEAVDEAARKEELGKTAWDSLEDR